MRSRAEWRRWSNAMRAGERHRWAGAPGVPVRLVARGLAAIANSDGTMVVGFGLRRLSLLASVDPAAAKRGLGQMRGEADPFAVLLEDRPSSPGCAWYRLRVPEEYTEAAAWRSWKPDRVGMHAVFRTLGGPAALVWEDLTAEPTSSATLSSVTHLPAPLVRRSLAAMAEHQMAVKVPGGWLKGPPDIDELTVRLGVLDVFARDPVPPPSW